eukprot:CAMPEP_0195078450 /NCGR_PEP_ID=MMETSP0448-20130528/20639_1 /TAXON_ID=66468 /ORGANISM="Heterocapsa triquestra, Strain CCMP 448" /LENGTH=66 /DNA_ID=CAMNT_0040111193 /DNA_START=143 /DNA_END=341 /DNA_ORIENTATION=-
MEGAVGGASMAKGMGGATYRRPAQGSGTNTYTSAAAGISTAGGTSMSARGLLLQAPARSQAPRLQG